MPGRKSISARRRAAPNSRKLPNRTKIDHAEELMDLAGAPANSRELPAFLAAFASRAAEMLGGEWGGVGEISGNRVQLYSAAKDFPGDKGDWEWLLENIAAKRTGLQVARLPKRTAYCGMFPIYASDRELMGTLCVMRENAKFSAAEEKLMTALASHASFSMEKVRRFSQLERSKKQWVEDIDAISDYIAVHDQAWKIVRTNRSLATELGIPPAALGGEPISSLRHIAETGSALPCPFCRDTREAREE